MGKNQIGRCSRLKMAVFGPQPSKVCSFWTGPSITARAAVVVFPPSNSGFGKAALKPAGPSTRAMHSGQGFPESTVCEKGPEQPPWAGG